MSKIEELGQNKTEAEKAKQDSSPEEYSLADWLEQISNKTEVPKDKLEKSLESQEGENNLFDWLENISNEKVAEVSVKSEEIEKQAAQAELSETQKQEVAEEAESITAEAREAQEDFEKEIGIENLDKEGKGINEDNEKIMKELEDEKQRLEAKTEAFKTDMEKLKDYIDSEKTLLSLQLRKRGEKFDPSLIPTENFTREVFYVLRDRESSLANYQEQKSNIKNKIKRLGDEERSDNFFKKILSKHSKLRKQEIDTLYTVLGDVEEKIETEKRQLDLIAADAERKMYKWQNDNQEKYNKLKEIGYGYKGGGDRRDVIEHMEYRFKCSSEDLEDINKKLDKINKKITEKKQEKSK